MSEGRYRVTPAGRVLAAERGYRVPSADPIPDGGVRLCSCGHSWDSAYFGNLCRRCGSEVLEPPTSLPRASEDTPPRLSRARADP